tara:strand:+ start:8188 stop:8415 length:228 start_codon:yes stop_codon:yes gene_type:complete
MVEVMTHLELVDDAKQAWKWISMQAMVLAAAIQGAWLYIPEDLKLSIPPNVVQGVTLVLLVAGVAGRLVKQEPKP